MNDRTVWSGDRNPITPENIDAAKAVWIRGGDYDVASENGQCYIDWGKKRILALVPMERGPGQWDLVLRQNPNMGMFPDKVMDGYATMLRPLVEKLTRVEVSPAPEI